MGAFPADFHHKDVFVSFQEDLHLGYLEVLMIRSYDHVIPPALSMDCGLCNVEPGDGFFDLKGEW